MIASLLSRLGRAPAATVPRARLTRISLKLPPLKPEATRQAIRLQLLPLVDAEAFAYVWRRQSADQCVVWLWPLQGAEATLRAEARSWPEPLTDVVGAEGARLLSRAPGFEGQVWQGGELLHSRWWPHEPDTAAWQQFLRGCGLAAAPKPSAEQPQPLRRPPDGWLRGDSLPPLNPWRGWQWQLALWLLLAVLSTAVGWHWQTRRQIEQNQSRLALLDSRQRTVMEQRASYENLLSQYQAMAKLAPQISQLALLGQILDSGILDPRKLPTPRAASAVTAPPTNTFAAQTPIEAATLANLLTEWDYRNGQLKLLLEVPEGELALLDITRRLEALRGFEDLRIGLDSTNTNLTLSLRVKSAP